MFKRVGLWATLPPPPPPHPGPAVMLARPPLLLRLLLLQPRRGGRGFGGCCCRSLSSSPARPSAAPARRPSPPSPPPPSSPPLPHRRVVTFSTRAVEQARAAHAATLTDLCHHPETARLRWRDLVAALESVGATRAAAPQQAGGGGHGDEGDEGADEAGAHDDGPGCGALELGGRVLALPPSRHTRRTPFATHAQLLSVRVFLQAAGVDAPPASPQPSSPAAAAAAAAHSPPRPPAVRPAEAAPAASLDGRHPLLVASASEVRLFLTHEKGASCVHLRAAGGHRHLHGRSHGRTVATPLHHEDREDALDRGVAASALAALRDAGARAVLVVGHGTGRSSAAAQLAAALSAALPGVGVALWAHADASHATDNELLAHARRHFAAEG